MRARHKTFIASIGLTALVLTGSAAGPAGAQTRNATGAIQVERALKLSTVQSMSFIATRRNIDDGAPVTRGDGDASDAPAVIDIAGDPGRVYRIQLPEAIDTELAQGVITGFRVWSETVGDVSTTMTGRLNAEGHDRLRISGVLSTAHGVIITDVQAAVPVNIDYE
jgi:hypothetical protein